MGRSPWSTLVLALVVVAVLLLPCSDAKAKTKKRRAPPPPPPRGPTGPVAASVHERGLVVQGAVSPASVLQESGQYHEDTAARRFKGAVLAYVTPWNRKGYDVARTFRAKFTHISPVWLQLRSSVGKLEVTGLQDIDVPWIDDLRAPVPHGEGQVPKILPRLVFELPAREQLDLLQNEALSDQAAQLLASECRRHSFDGLTLEAWPMWARGGMLQPQWGLRPRAIRLVRKLAQLLHAQGQQLVLVMPPAEAGGADEYSGVDDFDALKAPAHEAGGDPVDFFSLMTYDASNAGRPGPNAPIYWVQQNLEELLQEEARMDENAHRLLVGLNFFGNDFVLPQGGGPILGHEFLSTLEREVPSAIEWDKRAAEHVFEYNKDNQRRKVYFPSLASIQARLDLVSEMGAGISIWEIGQGLDYFYDLL